MKALLLPALFILNIGHAQTVYRCNGVYTDQPCKGGTEVDIAPTEGADSLSGKKQRSHEAQMRDINRMISDGQAKGYSQASQIMRCNELLRQRQSIDQADSSKEMTDRRLAIRQEQFSLKCKRQ